MKENGFRVLGSELGEPDTFIDVSVEGIDGDGTVYFGEPDGKREWDLSASDVRRLTNNNFMVGSSEVEAHPLWDRAKAVGEDQKKNAKTDYGIENLQKAQKNLFLAAWFETR